MQLPPHTTSIANGRRRTPHQYPPHAPAQTGTKIVEVHTVQRGLQPPRVRLSTHVASAGHKSPTCVWNYVWRVRSHRQKGACLVAEKVSSTLVGRLHRLLVSRRSDTRCCALVRAIRLSMYVNASPSFIRMRTSLFSCAFSMLQIERHLAILAILAVQARMHRRLCTAGTARSLDRPPWRETAWRCESQLQRHVPRPRAHLCSAR